MVKIYRSIAKSRTYHAALLKGRKYVKDKKKKTFIIQRRGKIWHTTV